MDNDCNFLSDIVVCRLSLLRKIQIPQAALRTDDAGTTTVPSQRSDFDTTYVAFHLFKFRQEEITGAHDVIVPSLMSKNMKDFQFFNVNVQDIHCVC